MDNRFNAREAQIYDDVIKRRIPLYNEIQTLMVSLIPFSKKEYLRVLDIGCGTGGTSVTLLKEFPLARVTGIDNSKDMLNMATAKVKQTTWRVDFVCRDIREAGTYCNRSTHGSEAEVQEEFDVVISAFSLHFFNEDEKKKIFESCVKAMKPGALFLTAEAIMPESAVIYQTYMEKWKEFQRSNRFSEDEIGDHMLKFVRDVKPSRVDTHLRLMKNGGLADADCYFKYLNWAVLAGYKQGKYTAT